MENIFARVIVAVIAVLLIVALIPPVFHVMNLPIGGDLETILRICVGGLGLFYIVRGKIL